MLRISTGTTINVNAYVKFESGTHETEYIPHWAVADLELRQKYDNPTVKFKMLNTHYIGDCCIFKDPSGKVLVIDCGGYTNTIAMNALEQALTDMQIYSVDYLIISHYHVDHVSGIQKFNQKGVLTSATKIYAPGGFAEHIQDITALEGNNRTEENYNLLVNTANSLGCTIINPSDGDTFTMG
jgi:glyoxylase-like metal-dependent hydrolase (beta-lactamase superfamily II)